MVIEINLFINNINFQGSIYYTQDIKSQSVEGKKIQLLPLPSENTQFIKKYMVMNKLLHYGNAWEEL